MSEEEWFILGDNKLEAWEGVVRQVTPLYEVHLSENEKSAFEYAWELAGREMGIIK